MAGQRRKKRKLPSESMENYKPELMFIESPLQGEKHYRTPVQAARNPFLAPVVPVEDDVSWKWVCSCCCSVLLYIVFIFIDLIGLINLTCIIIHETL